MATALSKQVAAYHDSVMQASRVAVECWDMHKPVQEAVLLSPGVVDSIRAVLVHPSSHGPEARQEMLQTCRDMLKSMGVLLHAAATLRDHAFELGGLPEFDAAMACLRFMIADLIEADEPPSKPRPDNQELQEFEDAAPPQSWYDEDFRALRGPMAK